MIMLFTYSYDVGEVWVMLYLLKNGVVYLREVQNLSRCNAKTFIGTNTSEVRRVSPLLSDQGWIG